MPKLDEKDKNQTTFTSIKNKKKFKIVNTISNDNFFKIVESIQNEVLEKFKKKINNEVRKEAQKLKTYVNLENQTNKNYENTDVTKKKKLTTNINTKINQNRDNNDNSQNFKKDKHADIVKKKIDLPKKTKFSLNSDLKKKFETPKHLKGLNEIIINKITLNQKENPSVLPKDTNTMMTSLEFLNTIKSKRIKNENSK